MIEHSPDASSKKDFQKKETALIDEHTKNTGKNLLGIVAGTNIIYLWKE